jgi:hypothetical protein
VSRRRWVYTEGGKPLPEPIEVGEDYRPPSASSTGDLGKFEYDNLRATDGTDISSRTKRRHYMQARGLADPRDFRETLPKAQAQREAFYTARTSTRELADTVGRVAHQLRSTPRRK